MEHAVVGLLMWLHGALSVHAQALEAPERRRVKAVQACIAAVAEADAPADGDAIAPPWGGMPSGDPVADADWLIRRAAEGSVAGRGVVKVLHYDAERNRVLIVHEVPRPPARVLRLGVPAGGF